ncbi:MAG TPA: PQQ-dependent catabolism-associated beta-propeller protein [Xanthomonadales bacterium]|nr:PQQ-dependent catabolism-associated beta-propeller protein [Xanthomonadales bacterium]
MKALASFVLLVAAGQGSAETLWVSDEQGDVLHALAPPAWQVVDRVAAGKRPRGIAPGPDDALVVAASDDGAVLVLDPRNGRERRRVPVGPDPERFAFAPDGRTLYVANEDDALVSFVDWPTGEVRATVEVGAEPEGIAASPDGTLVVATSESQSLVHFIDVHTATLVDSVLVGTRPRDAAFSADGRELWVSSEARGTLALFDPATHRVERTIDFQREPGASPSTQAVGIALARSGRRGFVALGRGNGVAEFDRSDGRIVRRFATGERTWSIALSPDERRLYAANGLSGDVTVVDLERNVVVATVKTGGKPWGLVSMP